MAKRIKNFVDRAFSRTVDLDLLHRLLQPHLGQIDIDWSALSEDERKKREAIFALFAKADAKVPPSLQFALYNISTLATDVGAKIIQEIASEAGVDVLAVSATGGKENDQRFTPRYIALVT
nr:hypothetical protein [Allgaiera sp.]